MKAKWSGSYPTLCFGRWTITLNDGTELKLPKSVAESNFGTAGEYEEWHFEDWNEVFESYYDGLERGVWVKENEEMLREVCQLNKLDYSKEFANEFYDAVSDEDWRHNSCGGCI